MNSINSKLLSEIKEHQFFDYGCEVKEIRDFLASSLPYLDRQRKAIGIIEYILSQHGKEKLLNQVAELARVEHGIQELQPWVRDHVVHALRSFILGIYLNEYFMSPLNTKSDCFQWKLVGLLHDVAYPAQIAKDILKPFSEKINEIKRDLNVQAPDVFFRVSPVNLDQLRNRKNSFDLIQSQLDKWGLRIRAKDEYEKMIEAGKMCHGMISGLSVLYVIDLLYQKFNPRREHKNIYQPDSTINWNQKYFIQDIIPACAAIFIHNLDKSRFQRSKINPHKAPLAFLLKLSDLLQEWERPSLENREGYDAGKFDISIIDGNIIFKADIPEERKREIIEELSATLDFSDIRIE